MVSAVTRHGRQPADQIILADQLRGALASSAASVCATCRRSERDDPGERQRLAAALDLGPQRDRSGDVEETARISHAWTRAAGDDARQVVPGPVAEHVVAADSGQQVAAHGMLGHRHHYMSVCRIQQTVPAQPAGRERTQQIKLLADLEPDPVVEPEMTQDDLLPRGFVRGGARETKRDGYRQRPLLAPREVDCHRQ